MRRFLPAIVLSLAGWLGAPFLGLIRDALLDAFSKRFLLTFAGALGLSFLALLAYGLWRIRERRPLRYGLLAAVAVLVALQTFVFNRGNLEVDVVEKVHFLQYGLLAVLVYLPLRGRRDLSTLLTPILVALLVGTVEEAVQWWVPLRVGEIKDILLNTYAGCCGLLVGWAFWPTEGQRLGLSRPAGRRLALLAAVALAGLGTFYDVAHLGQEVTDPAIGRFRSYFSGQQLQEISLERGRAWAQAPPDFRRILAKQDLYATEAGWHVGHRNVAREKGWKDIAWRENQILEKYYSPFLDVSLPGTPQGHRLGPEELARLRASLPSHLPGEPGSSGVSDYVSPVLADRIDTRISRRQLWAAVLFVLAPLLFVALRRGR
jgi:VanZ family protein